MFNTIADAVKALKTTDHNEIINALYHEGLYCGVGEYSECFLFPKEQKVLKITSNNTEDEIVVYKQMKNYDFIPKLYEHGVGYIVIEYIEGLTLQDKIREEGFDFSDESFWTQLFSILEAFKNEGLEVVDLHDENIIITPDNKVYVIDFGAYTPLIHGARTEVPVFMEDWLPDYPILEEKANYLINRGYLNEEGVY